MARRNPDPIPLPLVQPVPEPVLSCQVVAINANRGGVSCVDVLILIDGIRVPFTAPEEVARAFLKRLGLDFDAAWVEHESARLLEAATTAQPQD